MTAVAAPEAPVTIIRNRRATTDIELGTNAKGEKVVANVSSFHSKESKQLVATLNRVTISESGTPGFVVRQVIPTDGVRLFTDPITRYSDKALDSFHDDALDLVERFRSNGDNAKVNAIFAAAE